MLTLKEIKEKSASIDKEVRDYEIRIAQLQGQKNSAMQTLLEAFGCKTVEEAEKLVQTEEKKLAELRDEQQVLEAELAACEAKNA